MPPVAMSNRGGSTQNTMSMGSAYARSGAPDYGSGAPLAAMEMSARKHFVQPSNDGNIDVNRTRTQDIPEDARRGLNGETQLPYYYNNYDGLPVPYSGPTEEKEMMMLRAAIRDAAGKQVKRDMDATGVPGVVRTDPISDAEVNYLKSMKDQAELAKFDDYVESFIDPRMPGNMKWLMEIYPDYVNRRLQQAHTDYEFALRNQMIDSWGINTFDDLHFKFLVDQGKIAGPRLISRRPPIDTSYTPGWLSPFNFQSPNKAGTKMYLPFASATHGKRPVDMENWTLERAGRPLGRGNDENSLAQGMYMNPIASTYPLGAAGRASRGGLLNGLGGNPAQVQNAAAANNLGIPAIPGGVA